MSNLVGHMTHQEEKPRLGRKKVTGKGGKKLIREKTRAGEQHKIKKSLESIGRKEDDAQKERTGRRRDGQGSGAETANQYHAYDSERREERSAEQRQNEREKKLIPGRRRK